MWQREMCIRDRDYFLSNHPEFHLEEIPWCEGFCPGKPELVGSKFPLEHCVLSLIHILTEFTEKEGQPRMRL